jgi:ferrochelatase
MKKTAVILFNLGGPDNLKSVKGFLFNLFNDKAIIGLPQPFRFLLAKLISSRRDKKAQAIYAQIGGKSPILETTNSQAEALEKELSYFGNYKTFVAMRYWHPFSKDVVKKVKEYQPDEIIFLPLYPQFSTTTTASSFEDFYKKLKNNKVAGKLKYICCYPTNPQFISAHCRLIKQAIIKTTSAGFDNFRILFSAHGLPQKIIDAGDPYCFQVKASVDGIVKELAIKDLDHKICYQSKVGPLEWTKPSLEFEISRAALDKKAIIIVPIAFVSDHSETLVELDIEYREIAHHKKIPFYYRVPALNVDGYFIKSLVDICKRTSEVEFGCNGGDFGSRICPKNFTKCLNPNKNDN